MNRTKKLILISVLTVAFCLSLAVGSTHALLVDEASTNITVKSGKVDVNASITSNSLHYDNGSDDIEYAWPDGGAGLYSGNLEITNMSSGCSLTFTVLVRNRGTLATKWQLIISSDIDIFKYVTFSTKDTDIEFTQTSDNAITSAWQRSGTPQEGKTVEKLISVTIELPYSTETLPLSGAIYVSVNAVQANAPTV